MSDKIEKKAIINPAHPAIIPFDNAKSYIAKTGKMKKAKVRYEIVWPVPATDEEAKERYDCSLRDLIEMGIQIISHRPDYGALFEEKPDEYSAELHKALQTLADAYKPGQRVTGKGAQTKVEAAIGRKVQEQAAMLGFGTTESMMEALAELKKKKAKNN